MNVQIGTGLHIDNLDPLSKPIPLTEEWLERFGFEQHHDDVSFNSVIYIKKIFSNKPKEWGLYPKELGSGYVVNKSLHLAYVHQLQNIYFALTGEELTIKEDERIPQ